MLDYGEAKPDYSYALTRFDFKGANNAGAIDIKPVNHALSYIRIIGGSDFISREFNFTGYEYLKELYLVRIGDSKLFWIIVRIWKLLRQVKEFGNQENHIPSQLILLTSEIMSLCRMAGLSGIVIFVERYRRVDNSELQ